MINQVQYLIIVASRYELYHVRDYLGPNGLAIVFRSFVKPVCKYSTVAFMDASATHSSNSDRVQKSAMSDLLRSSTNQEVFEKHLCNYSSHYEKFRMISHYTKKANMCNHQINAFHCQQR